MNTQYSRILVKRTSTSGVVPTIPSSDSHLDGSWLVTDLYDGEMFINTSDNRVWYRAGASIVEFGGAGASGEGFGAIKNVDISDTLILDENRQNFIYGTFTVDGSFENNGEVVALNGEIVIAGTGEISGTGDTTIVTI